jgi:hypothetical protein
LISVIEDVKSALGAKAARDALGIDSSVVWSTLLFSFSYCVLAFAVVVVVVTLYRHRRDLAQAAHRLIFAARRLSDELTAAAGRVRRRSSDELRHVHKLGEKSAPLPPRTSMLV